MHDITLHHYELSPFSQKIRSLLGYTELPWNAVLTSPMLPRPLLTPVTGGYRRIPVAQLGADIYCDTRLIARKIAQQSQHNELFPEQHNTQSEALAAWADSTLLMLCVAYVGKSRYSVNLLRYFSPLALPKFFLDRVRLMAGANTRAMMPGNVDRELQRFLRDFERALAADFRFGSTPTIADFALYHPLWLTCEIARVPLLDPYPGVARWMQRISDFGDGAATPTTATQALAIATQEEPEPVAQTVPGYSDELINKRISITPDDYGLVPVSGQLIYADQHESILRCQHVDLGNLHLHFPRQGFVLKAH